MLFSDKKKAGIFLTVVIITVIVLSFFVVKKTYVTLDGKAIERTDIEKILNKKKTFHDASLDKTVSFTYKLKKSPTHLDQVIYEKKIDKEKLSSLIDALNEDASPAEDAKIVITDNSFSILPEKTGEKIGKEALLSAVNEGKDEIDINDYKVKPVITKEDLQKTADTLSSYMTWSCTYTNGEVIKPSPSAFTVNGTEIDIDASFIEESVKKATDSYNTVGKEQTFKNVLTGEEVKVKGGTWGNKVDIKAEVEALAEALKNNAVLKDRTPILSKDMGAIGTSYIYVDKSTQTMTLIKEGQKVLETPVVTGSIRAGHDTPTGVYYISEHQKNHVMKGDGYTTLAHEWLRLTNTGIGIHDAPWRGSFGGKIYLTNGSHGCVNTPPAVMKTLFDETYLKMPVIIT